MALRDNSDSACIYCLIKRTFSVTLCRTHMHGHARHPHVFKRRIIAICTPAHPFILYTCNYYCYYLTVHRTGYKKYININIPFQACRRANLVFMGICSVRKCVQTDVHTDVHTGLGELICSTAPKQISI